MASRRGLVLQVNVSGGGVPKLPVAQARVTRLGLEGDGHHERTLHGGPHRAVCLFAIEAIERLQSEGHPVEPGGVGENLTTTGIEWSLLPVGTRIRVGAHLELELASPTMPCATQKRNFVDGRFSRISIDIHPSDSRMYARVLAEGEVRPGDIIELLPPAPDSQAEANLVLARLDRADSCSSLAAWRTAAAAGFDVRIVKDGDLAMAAAPDLPGPAFNRALGLARMPHLLPDATAFFDRHAAPGWLVTDSMPWPGAIPQPRLSIFCAAPSDLVAEPDPAGLVVRQIDSDEADAYVGVGAAAGAGGVERGAPDPWPSVVAARAAAPPSSFVLAELGGQPVGAGSLFVTRRTAWLRGGAVVPGARGRGIQRALIRARARLATERGCDLLGASAEPGSISAANLERTGFRRIGSRELHRYEPA